MFHPKKIVTVLGITALMLGPVSLPSFDLGSGPAYANNGKGGGDRGTSFAAKDGTLPKARIGCAKASGRSGG